MQNRYAGDIGDFVKLALLRALAPDGGLGVCWYLFPDESHNSDGKHTAYLNRPERWRHLDPELFDALTRVVAKDRSVAALERSGVLGAVYHSEPAPGRDAPASVRSELRHRWFEGVLAGLAGTQIVFADPDNGLVDDGPERRRRPVFGKQMPLSEALRLTEGRTGVIYHHNTRYAGGHDREVGFWRERLGPDTLAVRASAYSCRTFFIVNPTAAVMDRAEAFCVRWTGHGVRLDA